MRLQTQKLIWQTTFLQGLCQGHKKPGKDYGWALKSRVLTEIWKKKQGKTKIPSLILGKAGIALTHHEYDLTQISYWRLANGDLIFF
jgi:hypothetical protein